MTHIAIIGGGIVGATIAYELSKNPELTVSLFEEKRGIEGSTKAALGVLVGISSQKKSGRAWDLREKSLKRYPSLISELEYLTQRSISHNSQGLVHLCFSLESLSKWQELQKIRQSQGWTLEIWDNQQLTQKCPNIAHKDLVAGIYSPADWQINPSELTEVLLEAASVNGVNLYLGQKISRLVIEGELKYCKGLVVAGEEKQCDYLVIAAGLGSVSLTTDLAQNLPMQPVLGQALQLRLEQKPDTDFQPVITGEDIHIVPLGGGEYWVGATVEYPDTHNQVEANSQLLQQVLEGAISFYPCLAQATIIKTWSGQRPRPLGRSAPIIEKLAGYNNIILATGHYRNGVLLAPATAARVKELLRN